MAMFNSYLELPEGIYTEIYVMKKEVRLDLQIKDDKGAIRSKRSTWINACKHKCRRNIRRQTLGSQTDVLAPINANISALISFMVCSF